MTLSAQVKIEKLDHLGLVVALVEEIELLARAEVAPPVVRRNV
ncbi:MULTISPECIES: hypothetical protein [Cyanophyceae]|nr:MULTISPECIES: hypothetical protein [Cyanophyceae]